MFRIENDFKSPNVPRTIRFTDRLFEELTAAAQENGVSFNRLVLQCCRYALDHLDRDDPE
ncbi:hypothetical protein [Gehongia tenuis]|uniref:Toxin-antitoxin system HicB family antitoxin n=1 Tax=Gehongia tenuis TaxID=2763655 RepID=A0A926D3H4_9FIRM|nr:hypothetical protein [Gehongia tenuis]MBC8530561.1 hypothetical protein [Gehongia tenuis]